MVNITIIGSMGTGKTTFIKSFISGRNKNIFDVNNEYRELGTDTNKPTSRMVDLDHKKFLKICLIKKNTCNVFEDATGFLEGRLSDDTRKILVSKRHTGNANLLVFHSMISVPPRLIQLSDYVVIFKTNDEFYQVEKKFPSLLDTWADVQQKAEKNRFHFKVIKL